MGSKIGKPKNEERQHDPKFGGPIKDRGCTDVICLLIFFAAVFLYVIVSTVAFYYGSPLMLILPKDSDGNACGFDNRERIALGVDMTNKRYLHMFDITKCTNIASNAVITGEIACPTTSVCMEECPSSMWLGYWELVKQEAGASVDYTKFICRNGVNPGTGPGEVSDVNDLIQTTFGGADGPCASYYFEEQPLLHRCLPSMLFDIIDTTVDSYEFIADNGTTYPLGPLDASGAVSAITGPIMQVIGEVVAGFYTAQGITYQILDDLVDCWEMMAVFMTVSCFLIALTIVLMGIVAKIVIWTLLIVVHVALLAGVYFCYLKYQELRSEQNVAEDPNNYNLEANMEYYSSLYQTWRYIGMVLAALFGIILLLTCFLFNRIRLAIQVIIEASAAVRSMLCSLTTSIFPWMLQLCIMAYFLVLTAYIASYEGDPVYNTGSNSSNASIANSDAGDPCTPTLTYDNVTLNNGSGQLIASTGNCYFQTYVGQDKLNYVHAYNIFMCLWLLNFVDAIGQCTLAGGYADYYWSRGKAGQLSTFFSLFRVLRYHIGSMAFGSFIIAVVQFIRLILEYLDRKLKKKKNLPAKIVLCMCKCFFWCFEKFIKFISKNAYILIAIYGRNFCFSAMDAFFLILRNAVRVAVVNGITAFLIFVSKMALTASMVFASFLFFSGHITAVNEWVPDLNYYFIPIIVIGVMTYIVASIFLDTYDMAVDTIFLCVLEDMERNDGSPEKPYHMSDSLMSILGKKNDFK
ncbi:choline transporter-like protein 2 [Symsagittifera roscoffensis]|uniref:choline transporter-like protein 2 n=1 Tax=Symsagittifera roscoffensis TaxID=84072 RepID=UPI00307B8072